MASFPELRYCDLFDLPSASAEGCRVFRDAVLLRSAALLRAAVAAFVTVSELATLRGAAKATPAPPTRTPGALSNAGLLVGMPTLNQYSRVAA
jgi:hypothetical protein